MAALTPAQEEFQTILDKQSSRAPLTAHPEDSQHNHDEDSEQDEESKYQADRVAAEMKYSSGSNGEKLTLPHKAFDEGRTTGVKGVIADARSYEEAKRTKRAPNGSSGQNGRINRSEASGMLDDEFEGLDSEDEEFMERWREERKMEMQREGNDIRNRRTSPSVRRFGRFDEVDALGYLDAIEKVGKEVVVVVFIYDVECPVSQVIETAITPLVAIHPAIHFVKVHYDEIEFDNAGVPAILAYKNQGDLFANLTYIIDQIPDDTLFDTQALKDVLVKHRVI